MTPTDKALLLQAVAEMTRVNNDKEGFISVKDNCKEVANLILESIKKDFKKQNP